MPENSWLTVPSSKNLDVEQGTYYIFSKDNFYLDESRLEFETDSRNTDDVY